MSTTRHLAAFTGAPPEIQAFWRLWFGSDSAPGKIQVDNLTTLMGSRFPDKTQHTMAAGHLRFHGSGYHSGENAVFFVSREWTGAPGSQYRLVKVDADDLTSYSYHEESGKQMAGDLCIVGDYVYVVYKHDTYPTRCFVDRYDATASPVGSPTTYDLGEGGHITEKYEGGDCIDSDGTNLFIGTFNEWVLRVPISTMTVSHDELCNYGQGSIHTLRYDSANSQVVCAKDGTGPSTSGPTVYFLPADDLNPPVYHDLELGFSTTDDSAIANGYYWVGCEGASGTIARVLLADITTHDSFQGNTQSLSCYGVWEEPEGDYVWAVWATSPGELTRIKANDTSDQQRVWLSSGENYSNELVFCGSKDKIVVSCYLNPVQLVRLTYLTVDTDDPVLCSTTQYSFWHPIRLYIEAAAEVDTMKVWSDGANGLGSNITIMGNVADRYQKPSQSELTTGNYTGLDANGEDVFTNWTSGAKKSIAGSATAKGDVGTAETDNCFLVIQMKFVLPCPAGDTPTEVLTFTHEDYAREQEKDATFMGDVTPAPTLAGALAPTGTLGLKVERVLVGALPSSGVASTVATWSRSFAGNLAPGGIVATIRTQVISLAGTLIPAGGLLRKVSISLSGAIGVLTGTLVKKVLPQTFAGTLTLTGYLVPNLLTEIAYKVLAGAVVSSGTLARKTATTLAGVLTLGTPVTADLQVEIEAGADDGDLRPSYGWNNTDYFMHLGSDRYGWWHWPSVAIPKGAAIQVAKVQLRAYSSDLDACDLRIEGCDEDDSAALTSWADYVSRSKTALVNWNSVEAWTAGTWYWSASIKAIVEAITGREGWNPGQAMQVIVKGLVPYAEAERRPGAYDGGASYGAKLYIEYTVPGGGVLSTTATWYRSLAGTLSSSGKFVAKAGKALGGTLTSSSSLVFQVSKMLAGVLASSGILATASTQCRSFAGTVTSAGSLTANLFVGTFYRTFYGTLTSTGALARSTSTSLAGALTSSGVVSTVATWARSLAGTLSSAGALSRSTTRRLWGSLTPAGAVVAVPKYIKALSGVVSSSGALATTLYKFVYTVYLAGSVTPSGVLSGAKITLQSIAGVLTSTGAVATQFVTGKAIGGTLTMAGGLVSVASKVLGGVIAPVGTLRRWVPVSLSGVLGFTGRVFLGVLGLGRLLPGRASARIVTEPNDASAEMTTMPPGLTEGDSPLEASAEEIQE